MARGLAENQRQAHGTTAEQRGCHIHHRFANEGVVCSDHSPYPRNAASSLHLHATASRRWCRELVNAEPTAGWPSNVQDML